MGRKAFLSLFLGFLSITLTSAYGDHLFPPVRKGHFFLPDRTLFFFRPDLYLHSQVVPLVYGPLVYSPPACDVFSLVDVPRTYGIYRLMLNSPPAGEIVRANTADMIFSVHPARALVYIDGKLIGSARDFATERDRYSLISGSHHLRIEFPGHRPFETELEVTPNRTLHLDIELEPVGR